MKRMLCFLTILLTAGSVLSCGAETKPETAETESTSLPVTGTETAETTAEPSLLDSLGEKDLEGYTYTVYDCNCYRERHINIPGDSMNGEVVNDALIQRDTALEDLYNCKIEYVQNDDFSVITKMTAAGEDTYQMVIHPLTRLQGPAQNGTLANLCEVPYLEMDKTWWNPLMYENMRLNNAMYFTSSDIAPSIYQMPCCLFLNLKLYQDYDFEEDIFQMVLDGKWTIDALKTMTKGMDQDLNNDGKWILEDDFFGFESPIDTESIFAMMVGMGVNFSQLNDDKTEIDCNLLNNQRAMQVLESLAGSITVINTKEKIDFAKDLFKEDRALFMTHKLESAAYTLRDMESDYLILPEPKLNEEQESYYSFLSPHGSSFIALPQTVQENENAGFLTEALARYSHQYVRPIAFDLVYKEKDSRDPRTVDVLDILLDNLYIDFATLYEFGSVGKVLPSIVFQDKPIVSTLEKRQAKVEQAVNKFIEHWNPLG